MAGENEDFGINDPNILALLSGVNNPQAMASLLSAADNSGAMFLPGIKRRQQETTRSVLEMMGENNTARALLHNKKLNIGRAKDEETYAANVLNHLPGAVNAGIDPNEFLPIRSLLTRGNTMGGAAQLGREGKIAYNQNQRAEAFLRHAQTGQVVDEEQSIDPNAPRMPMLRKDSGRIPSVLEALARANANNGKVKAIYAGEDDKLIQSEVTLPVGATPPRNLQGLVQPGTDRDAAPAPSAEQAVRNMLIKINKNLAKVPIAYDPKTNSYVARYDSVEGPKTVRVAADPKRRPLENKITVE